MKQDLPQNAPRTFDEICGVLKIASRPATVMVTLFLAMDLIKKSEQDKA